LEKNLSQKARREIMKQNGEKWKGVKGKALDRDKENGIKVVIQGSRQ
jgi:hypothetical protein